LDNQSAFATQSLTVTVENVNDAPTMSDLSVVPETGTNKDKYVFSLKYFDIDGDSGSAKVIINGVALEMNKVGGDPINGEVFSIETGLAARNHTYYFEIDDDEDHNIASNVSVISVSAADVDEDDLLPIPLWWIILILIIVIVAILLNHSRVKRKLKGQIQSQRQYQPVPQRIERPQPTQPKFDDMVKEEPDSSLLDFGK
jgi:hypothetical protein